MLNLQIESNALLSVGKAMEEVDAAALPGVWINAPGDEVGKGYIALRIHNANARQFQDTSIPT